MKTELHVPSDLRFLTVVENWLLTSMEMELGDHVDWPRHSNRWRLVLAEAYSNVVRHAHREQPHIPVLLRLELKERDIALEVLSCCACSVFSSSGLRYLSGIRAQLFTHHWC